MKYAIFESEPTFKNKIYVGMPNIPSKREYLHCLSRILSSRMLTNDGPYVKRFEEEVADIVQVKNVVAVANATIGLSMALYLLNNGSETIVPSLTFIATAHSSSFIGLRPRFVDIEKVGYNMDPFELSRNISKRVGAIVPVHLWGIPCSVNEIQVIAERQNIPVIYDSAHSFGASYKNRKVGGNGQCEVFSFHATKFINSIEGGAITTNDDSLALELRKLRNFGFVGYDDVESIGINGKMSEIHASMGLVNIMYIDNIVERNYENYAIYREMLRDSNLKIVEYSPDDTPNYQYVVAEYYYEEGELTRDQLVEVLHAENLIVRRYFYPGCHGMKAYNKYEYKSGNMKNTERRVNSTIVLPTGLSVSAANVRKICRMLLRIMENSKYIAARINAGEANDL